MSSPTRYTVMVNGAPHDLTVIPGDLVKMERHFADTPAGQLEQVTWMLWTVAVRQTVTSCTYDEWLDGVLEDMEPAADPKA